MAKCLVDKYSKEELEQMAQDSISMKELCRKIGYTNNGNNHKTVQSRLDKYNISTEHFTGVGKNTVKRNVDNVFVKNSTATQATLRRWYLKEEYTLIEARYNQRTQKNYCIDCEKEISKDAQRCEECNHLSARVTERPSKEELSIILYQEKGNFSKVGRICGVSDNAVRKWCKSYGLPHHSSDYK